MELGPHSMGISAEFLSHIGGSRLLLNVLSCIAIFALQHKIITQLFLL